MNDIVPDLFHQKHFSLESHMENLHKINNSSREVSPLLWIVENLANSKEVAFLKETRECRVVDYQTCQHTTPWTTRKCLFYGGVVLCSQLQPKLCRMTEPFAFFTKENYNCSNYYPMLSKHLINKYPFFCPIGLAINNRDVIFKSLDNGSKKVFVRPNKCTKPFTGFSIHFDEFDEQIVRLQQDYLLSSNEMLVFCPYKNIVRETRFFVVNNEIISWSDYLPEETNKIDGETLHFAQNVVAELKWSPDDAYVVDIGLVRNGLSCYKGIVEINCINTSGWYSADYEKIASAMEHVATQPQSEEA